MTMTRSILEIFMAKKEEEEANLNKIWLPKFYDLTFL
jgi:hypothetical protein